MGDIVRCFCTYTSLTTVTPNWQLSHSVQEHSALRTLGICSGIPLLCKDTRHVQMIMHLHPLKGHHHVRFSSLLLPLPCFQGYWSLRAHTELVAGEGKHPPLLQHQNHLAPSFHKHDRNPPTALTSADSSFKGTVAAVYPIFSAVPWQPVVHSQKACF